MPDVRCVDCGFLALRHLWNRTLVEADLTFRNCATIPGPRPGAGGYNDYGQIPICFALAVDFSQIIKRDEPSAVLPEIQKRRPCDSFAEWKHGFSPKEHQEMLDRQWLLDFETRREDADRQWRQQCDERDKVWREQQSLLETRRHRQNLLILGAGAIVMGLVGAIAGSMIQAGWIQKPAVFDAPANAPESAPLLNPPVSANQAASPNFGQIGAPSAPVPAVK